MSTPQDQEQLHGMTISDTAINHPVFIAMMVLLALVIGLISYRSLPVNFLPDFSVPNVSVSVSYTGADPETVQEQVTRPLEDAVTTVTGVSHVTSTSSQGSSQVAIEFADGTDPAQALQDVREKINAVVPRLPDGVTTPVYRKFDPNDQPVLQMAVASDGSLSALDLHTLIENDYAPVVERVEGVGDVTVAGGQTRQINVYLNLSRLQAYGLSPSQISSAISAANTNQGLGSITSNDRTINLRSPSQITKPLDIGEVAIGGTNYRVKDVATVEDGLSEATSYARLDGQDAVTLAVQKQSGSNTLSVAENSRKQLVALFAKNPHLHYVITNDQSTEISSSVNSSIEEIIIAVVAALLVVLLFFRDLPNTLVTMAGLPVILILTFGLLKIFGISINIFSLLALSLSVGLVIDDAIVVRENIFRFREHGYSARQAASRGTAQVSLSVLAMTLTIIAVFMPVALSSGITGAIFKAFGLTVAGAMGLSLLEAFTFAPMLSANLFTHHKIKNNHQTTQVASHEEDLGIGDTAELGLLSRGYARVLRWALGHRLILVIVAIVVLAGSVQIARGLTLSFIPAQTQTSFNASFSGNVGTALAVTDKLARQGEAIIKADPDVVAVQSNVGGNASQSASFTVRVKETANINAVRNRLKPKLASVLPGLVLSTQSFQGGGGTGVTSRNVQVQIQSTRSISDVQGYANQIAGEMQKIQGFTDVGTSYDSAQPEIQVRLKNTQANNVNLNNSSVGSTLRALINGDTATTWDSNGDDVDVVVRLPASERASLDTLENLQVVTSSGNVPLGNIATLEPGTGPTTLRRYDRQNNIVVGANVATGLNQSQLEAQLQQRINQLGLPDTATVSFGGQTRNQNQGFSSLFLAMGLSILFVYMVLASQFNSFSQPFVIMLAMPFSLLGAFVALRLTGLSLDITSMIGLIMLLGLVVKNSILLVDFTNQLRKSGISRDEAIEHAGAIRLRPILMTSSAIIAGALPTAFGIHFITSGSGSEFRKGLGIVLVGGMLTSTILTLLFVPVAYSLLDGLLSFLGRVFRRKPKQPQPVATTTLATAGAAAGSAPISAVPVGPRAVGAGDGHGASASSIASERPSTGPAVNISPIIRDDADTY